MLKLKESDIRRQVKDYLKIKGWFVYYNLAGLGSYPGLSDLVAVKDGRIVHIEVKGPKGQQSEDQIYFEIDLAASGGEYLLVREIEDLAREGI